MADRTTTFNTFQASCLFNRTHDVPAFSCPEFGPAFSSPAFSIRVFSVVHRVHTELLSIEETALLMGVRTWGQMGSADLPGKMDEKLKSENMQKRAVFYVYVIF